MVTTQSFVDVLENVILTWFQYKIPIGTNESRQLQIRGRKIAHVNSYKKLNQEVDKLQLTK